MTRPVVLTFSARVRASPERVWAVLGDFGTEHRWTRHLTHSERDRARVDVGTIRRCTLARPVFGKDTIEEELVAFTPGDSLAYRVRGGMGPFTRVESRWSTRAVADGTLVEARATLTPRNALVGVLLSPILRAYLRYSVRGAVREFATFVEATVREEVA